MTIFYFTATGNSLAVAKSIGSTLVSIPQALNAGDTNFKDDVIGIVFPVYWWNLPLMVRKFIDTVSFEADYLFAIGTCGNVAGGAMASLQKQAKKKNYEFHYTNLVKMLDNYLPVFEIGAQIKKLPKKNVSEQLALITSDISQRKKVKTKLNIFSRFMTLLFVHIFKPKNNALKYIVSESCNNCGTCARVCPAANITLTDKISFGNQCEGCLACLHLCPLNALKLKSEKSDMRWRHPDIPLSEIIEANNQKSDNSG